MSPVITWLLKLLGLAIGAAGIAVGTKVYKMKHDSVIEEIIEEHIEDHTGLDVDITPDSEEDKPSKE